MKILIAIQANTTYKSVYQHYFAMFKRNIGIIFFDSHANKTDTHNSKWRIEGFLSDATHNFSHIKLS